jgi:Ribonuclease III domain
MGTLQIICSLSLPVQYERGRVPISGPTPSTAHHSRSPSVVPPMYGLGLPAETLMAMTGGQFLEDYLLADDSDVYSEEEKEEGEEEEDEEWLPFGDPASFSPTALAADSLRPRFAGGDGSHERLALVGDRALSYLLARRGFDKSKLKTEGDMSVWASTYARNDVMARYVDEIIVQEHLQSKDIKARLGVPWISRLRDLSEHTRATVFEAFLGYLEVRNLEGSSSVGDVVESYMEWVDENVDANSLRSQMVCTLQFDEQGKLLGLQDDGTHSRANGDEAEGTVSSQPGVPVELIQHTLSEWVDKERTVLRRVHPPRQKKVTVVPIAEAHEMAKQQGSWKHIRVAEEATGVKGNEGGHFAVALSGTRWRSRSGIRYTDFYWPCCGKPTCTLRTPLSIIDDSILAPGDVSSHPKLVHNDKSICNRVKYPAPFTHAVHPGKLRDIGGGKKGGGGAHRGGSESHIAKGATPSWDCCDTRVGAIPGCSLDCELIPLHEWLIVRVSLELHGSLHWSDQKGSWKNAVIMCDEKQPLDRLVVRTQGDRELNTVVTHVFLVAKAKNLNIAWKCDVEQDDSNAVPSTGALIATILPEEQQRYGRYWGIRYWGMPCCWLRLGLRGDGVTLMDLDAEATARAKD